MAFVKRRLSSLYNSWETKRDADFLGLLEKAPSAKVIDLGCGGGIFSNRVKEIIGCEDIWGFELFEDAVADAAKRGVRVQKADLNEFLPLTSESFDVVVSNQVFEHLFYPTRFFNEIFRILKPGGYAIISTENLAAWDNITALLFANTPFSLKIDDETNILSHVHVFAWKGLISLAVSCNFTVEKSIGNGHIFGRIGEKIDKKHSRFVTVKLKKGDKISQKN
jgi:SAM-dependent methyltransferase